MSLEVGLKYPRVFAGIVGVSGYVCDPELLVQELSPVARQQRILVTHGYMDPLIPFTTVRQQIRLLIDAGLRLQWREIAKAHNFAGEPEIAVIRAFVTDGYPGG